VVLYIINHLAIASASKELKHRKKRTDRAIFVLDMEIMIYAYLNIGLSIFVSTCLTATASVRHLQSTHVNVIVFIEHECTE
jgi:hypothetical protein